MISKIKELGEYYLSNFGEQNPLQLNTTLQEADVLLMQFKLNEDNCQFLGIQTMQFDQSKNKKLLLKNTKGNTVSEFPTIFLDKDKPEKSMKKLKRILENNYKTNPAVKLLYQAIISEENAMLEQLIHFTEQPQRILLSLEINGRLIGDSPIYQFIKEKTKTEKYSSYYNKYGTISKGENSCCYVCGEKKDELWGYVSTFNFYSSNEFAYIAGGFKKENSWKNYPVCADCARKLEAGRTLIKEKLTFPFYGFRYYLIPQPVLDSPDYDEMLEIILSDYSPLQLNQAAAGQRARITDADNEVLDLLAGQKNIATFTLFFFEENNSEFKILQEVVDILPSRFKTLFEVKDWVEAFPEFHNFKGLYAKKEIADLRFNFGIVRTFFNSKFNNDFLDISAKILLNKPISKSFVLHRISDYLAEKFRREEMYYEFFKAMMLIKVLYKLNLIENQPLKKEIIMDNPYEEYFNKHPDFFNADIKKAIFLEGVLTQNLLDIQFRERSSTPFRSRLNGLKIDARILKRLLPEAIEKLEQYGKNFYRELEQLIALYLVSGEPDLKYMSVNEISFFFTMGMNLAKNFKQTAVIGGENHE